jgi:hypothetical protein
MRNARDFLFGVARILGLRWSPRVQVIGVLPSTWR